MTTAIPRDKSIESTAAFRLDPYGFISKRCRQLGSDVFEARLMLRRTICMTGREAAELFYDPKRFIRKGGNPGPIVKTLLGKGGVQNLDDEAHGHRKRMFLSVLAPERVAGLADATADAWHAAARRWGEKGEVVLYDELHELLTRAVCAWAGVPLPEDDVRKRTRQLTALFDKAGSVGPGHLWSRWCRARADAWAAGLVEDVRAGRLDAPAESALRIIATHRELGGDLMPPKVAGVELVNVLRPTVAISVFIVFAAHALHQHPECRRRLQANEDGYAELFAQEVRRFYPFFPAIGARVREDFEWRGFPFPRGRRVMLDLYGINHDPRIWGDPDDFRPERFRETDAGPFGFVPQGGGEYANGHRCPGEPTTVELMKVSLRFLAGGLAYEAPEQDLSIDMKRLPALPRSRFVMRNVKLREGAERLQGALA